MGRRRRAKTYEAAHTCPICLSQYIERASRRGVLDHMARLLRWRVYRCQECEARFYDVPLHRKAA